MARIACLVVVLLSFFTAIAQTDTLSSNSEEAKQIFDQLRSQVDSTQFLRDAAVKACGCIDSVRKIGGNKTVIMDRIHGCIQDQSVLYQSMMKIYLSLRNPDAQIIVTTDEKDPQYQHYYFALESRLKDSCKSLNDALFSNDDVTSDKSHSSNPEARAAFNKGLPFLNSEDFAGAIPWFEKAVAIDADFAFAWDNLGISYRKTNQLEKAVAAYRSSLKADPKGHTPLQNLPVALGMLNRADEAIEAYKNLLVLFPGDPEAYYGMGMIYLQNKKDFETALDQFCEAYNLYVEQKSPYRSDAESMISAIYRALKKDGKESVFDSILKKHHINPEK
jgi:tetratricopeptide (TPR) repeat protein